MQGDCVQVQQVVLNLVVLNAVEAMGWVEAVAREFVISTERTKMGGVLVAVRDCFGRPQGTLPVAEPQGASISTLVAMRSSMRLIWASSGSKRVMPAATGRALLSSLGPRVQSSRRLEREAGRNLEVIWLLGQFVALCRDMGLLTKASVKTIRRRQ